MQLIPELFERIDETSDDEFYSVPRLVTHVDDVTVANLSQFYAELLPGGGTVLDLMSSWISHLPPTPSLDEVVGLGMNAVELEENQRLNRCCVHDLNQNPQLPFDRDTFDVVLNAFSVQYLTRPLEVFTSIADVLKPNGTSVVAMSHRCFPTKAVRAFHQIDGPGRFALVSQYHEQTGRFAPASTIDRSPVRGDPLWIVTAKKVS